MNDMNMKFAQKIQNLRKNRNLSQEELAEKLDISRQSVSKWESGVAMPEIDKLIMLSEIFEVTTDYLLKDNEPYNVAHKNSEVSTNEDIDIIEENKKLDSYKKEELKIILTVAGSYIKNNKKLSDIEEQREEQNDIISSCSIIVIVYLIFAGIWGGHG